MGDMKAIQLWTVEERGKDGKVAKPVEELRNTETEEMLEELLVRSPEVLMKNLVLVGRQVPTDGGPLDLLGIDEDGRLVVFELKRGTLTRDAVAQALDYASDLAGMDADRVGEMVEEYSGRLGVDKIEDFADWYEQGFPNSQSTLGEKPRIVLVGLGVDERARRVVNFLAEANLDIQLLTFHAFRRGEELLLARQVETVTPAAAGSRGTSSSRYNKEANLKALRQSAQELGVLDLLERVAEFLAKKLPAYQYPGKTGYTFSLTERTERGTPTLRQYVSVYLVAKKSGNLNLVIANRAVDAAGEAMQAFQTSAGKAATWNEKWKQVEVRISTSNWGAISSELETLLAAIVDGWKVKSEKQLEEEGGDDDGGERPSVERGTEEESEA